MNIDGSVPNSSAGCRYSAGVSSRHITYPYRETIFFAPQLFVLPSIYPARAFLRLVVLLHSLHVLVLVV